jgi:hypothetical protein
MAMSPERILEWELPVTAGGEYLPKVMFAPVTKGTSERWKAMAAARPKGKEPSPIRYKECRKFSGKTRFAFALANFPFWRLSIDGVPTQHSADAATLEVEVPAGQHCIEARLVYPRLTLVGFGTSACALLLFFLFLARLRGNR